MRQFALILALVSAFGVAGANELDNENSVKNINDRVEALPQTLIVRVNESTGAVEVLHKTEALAAEGANLDKIAAEKFTAVKEGEKYAANSFSELDADQSRESWYFMYWSYPAYGYGAYAYPYSYAYAYPYYYSYGTPYAYYPYYGYSYYGYNYSWYRPYGYYYRYW